MSLAPGGRKLVQKPLNDDYAESSRAQLLIDDWENQSENTKTVTVLFEKEIAANVTWLFMEFILKFSSVVGCLDGLLLPRVKVSDDQSKLSFRVDAQL